MSPGVLLVRRDSTQRSSRPSPRRPSIQAICSEGRRRGKAGLSVAACPTSPPASPVTTASLLMGHEDS